MADSTTPTYSLIQPEIDGADGTWGVSTNSNWLSVDNLLSGVSPLTTINVTGAINAGSLNVQNSTGAAVLKVEGTYAGGSQWANAGVIEIGGLDQAWLDLKAPNTDDYDVRLLHNRLTNTSQLVANNGSMTIVTAQDSPVILSHQSSAKLQTTSTGIDVTGTTDTDNLTINGAQGSNGQVLTSTGSGIEWAAGGGGGGGTLAETLALGNDTGANDINVTGTQKITFGTASLISETGTGDLRLQVGSADVLVATSAGVQSSPTMALRSTSIIDQDLINYFGMRLLNNATTVTTYAIPQVSITQVGKTVVICNPTNKTITLDADGGTDTVAQWVWILDGVTLMARNGDWQIKAGGVVELVQVGSDIAGGSETAPNYVIFGAGILAI